MAEPCVRRLAIECYSAGELTGAAAAGLEEHLSSCPSCSAYLAELKREREEFLRVHPFAEFIAGRAAAVRGGPWYAKFPSLLSLPGLRPVLVPAACVLLVAFVVVPYLAKLEPAPGSDVRYKGTEALSYIYKRGGAVRNGAPEDLFKGGDQVQIFYSSASDRNLSLFSIDGKGAVSFYQPESCGAVCSVRSGTGSRCAYPASIELDSTEGSELVVGVFSEKPFDTDQIKKWVAGYKIKNSDVDVLERAIKANPPEKNSSVLTLILKKG